MVSTILANLERCQERVLAGRLPFNEDVEGMGALEAVMGDVDDQHYQISVANGAPAVAMRMYLKKRAEAER